MSRYANGASAAEAVRAAMSRGDDFDAELSDAEGGESTAERPEVSAADAPEDVAAAAAAAAAALAPEDPAEKAKRLMEAAAASKAAEAEAVAALQPSRAVVEELLLVCTYMGTNVGEDGDEFVRGEECSQWLVDLQRALRRDSSNAGITALHNNDAVRPVALKVAELHVVETRLIPLLVQSSDDSDLVLTLLKIFVMVTTPMNPQAAAVVAPALRKLPFARKKKQSAEDGDRVAPRAVVLSAPKQLAALRSYKAAFADPAVVRVLASACEAAMARSGAARTPEDNLMVEVVLTLCRNLLCVPDAPGAADVHFKLVVALERELVLDVVLLLAADIKARENKAWNMLLLDIVSQVTRGQTPKAVARAAAERAPPPAQAAAAAAAAAAAPGPAPAKRRGAGLFPAEDDDGDGDGDEASPPPSRPAAAARTPATAGGLGAKLAAERLKRGGAKGQLSRHTFFGGAVTVRTAAGKASIVNPVADVTTAVPQAARVASQIVAMFVPDANLLGDALRADPGLGAAAVQCRQALCRFCARLFEDGFEELLTSTKTEVQRDVKTLQSDHLMLFDVAAFFLAFQRHGGVPAITRSGGSRAILAVDYLMLRLVGKRLEERLDTPKSSFEPKHAREIERCTAYYLEFMLALAALSGPSATSTQRTIGFGMLNAIFYSKDALDQLQKICNRSAVPGVYSASHGETVLETVHCVLKMLDGVASTSAKALETNSTASAASTRGIFDADDDADTSAPAAEAVRAVEDAQLRESRVNAAGFNRAAYLRKLAAPSVVRMYVGVLEGYARNSTATNYHAVRFFDRLCTHKISPPSTLPSTAEAAENAAALSLVADATLEPLLWSFKALALFADILNDATLGPQHKQLRAFAATVHRHFGRAAAANPLLYAELVVGNQGVGSHSGARWCEGVTSHYAAAECRDIAVRGAEEALGKARRAAQASDPRYRAGSGLLPPDDDDSDDGADIDAIDAQQLSKKGLRKAAKLGGSSAQGAAAKSSAAKKKKRAAADGGPSAKRRKGGAWTESEDRALREGFDRFKATIAKWDSIADLDGMEARSAKDVEKRAKALKLGKKGGDEAARRQELLGDDSDSSDSDDQGAADDKWNDLRKFPSSQADATQAATLAVDSDSDSDDGLFGTATQAATLAVDSDSDAEMETARASQAQAFVDSDEEGVVVVAKPSRKRQLADSDSDDE